MKDATTDEQQIRGWWKKWPKANIGVATGRDSGLIALDVDPRHAGDESLDELQHRYGPLPDTVEVLTGGGGRHLLFAYPGTEVRNATGFAGLSGLDVRGDGGYVVAPPSVHISGRRYEWESSSHPDDVPLAQIPQGMLALLTDRRRWFQGNGRPDSEAPADGMIPKGKRNSTLTSIAGSLRHRGCDEQTILESLRTINSRRCVIPLSEDEVRQIATSISRYRPGEGGTGKDDFHRTDLGNAKRLVAGYGDQIRFVPQWDKWLVWDGTRWAKDESGEAVRFAKETVLQIYIESTEVDTETRKALVEHAKRSESEARIRAMITLARTEKGVPVMPDELDADPWKLNCLNGSIDLKTGELLPHHRDDLITKLAPVEYDPDASLPLWVQFLNRIQPDLETRSFLQRAIGCSITGLPTEERLFFAHGQGATGKSTFFESIRSALGDYAATADFETFLKRQSVSGGPRNDIARLAGARFVTSLEVDDGRRLAEGLVKQMTGGDKLAARFLHKETFEFQPSFTLWLAANHQPRVRHDDDAIWRRILQIPFTEVIPEEVRDPGVKATLKDPEVAGPAVLAYAVKGCFEWQEHGLGVPPGVKEATAEYRREMNPLRGFLEDCCDLGGEPEETSGDLWDAYQQWGKQTRQRNPLGRKKFAEALEAAGCQDRRTNTARFWTGIELRKEARATWESDA